MDFKHTDSSGAITLASNDASQPLLDAAGRTAADESSAATVVGEKDAKTDVASVDTKDVNTDVSVDTKKDVELSLQQQWDNLQQKLQALEKVIALIEKVIFNRYLPLRILTSSIMTAVTLYLALDLVPNYNELQEQFDAKVEPLETLATALAIQQSDVLEFAIQALSNFTSAFFSGNCTTQPCDWPPCPPPTYQPLTVSCIEPLATGPEGLYIWNKGADCVTTYPEHPYPCGWPFDPSTEFVVTSNPCPDLWASYCEDFATVNAVTGNVTTVNAELDSIYSERTNDNSTYMGNWMISVLMGEILPLLMYGFLKCMRYADLLSCCFFLNEEQQRLVATTAQTYNINYDPAALYQDTLQNFKVALNLCKAEIENLKPRKNFFDVQRVEVSAVLQKVSKDLRSIITDYSEPSIADFEEAVALRGGAVVLAVKGSVIFAPAAAAKKASTVAGSGAGSAGAFEPMDIMSNPAPHTATRYGMN